MEARRPPRLSAISRRRDHPRGDLAGWLAGLALAAPPAVLLREKDLPDAELLRVAREARSALPASTRLLVAGRADVALAAGADGVHLAAAGLPTAAVVKRFGDRLLVGRSTHRLDEVAAALKDGADYAFFSPVWATPGKGPAAGVQALAQAAALGLPVLALGGVTAERLAEATAAGAWGGAGIRLFADAGGAAAAVAALGRLFPAGE